MPTDAEVAPNMTPPAGMEDVLPHSALTHLIDAGQRAGDFMVGMAQSGRDNLAQMNTMTRRVGTTAAATLAIMAFQGEQSKATGHPHPGAGENTPGSVTPECIDAASDTSLINTPLVRMGGRGFGINFIRFRANSVASPLLDENGNRVTDDQGRNVSVNPCLDANGRPTVTRTTRVTPLIEADDKDGRGPMVPNGKIRAFSGLGRISKFFKGRAKYDYPCEGGVNDGRVRNIGARMVLVVRSTDGEVISRDRKSTRSADFQNGKRNGC